MIFDSLIDFLIFNNFANFCHNCVKDDIIHDNSIKMLKIGKIHKKG